LHWDSTTAQFVFRSIIENIALGDPNMQGILDLSKELE
jgi:hypothetical protein